MFPSAATPQLIPRRIARAREGELRLQPIDDPGETAQRAKHGQQVGGGRPRAVVNPNGHHGVADVLLRVAAAADSTWPAARNKEPIISEVFDSPNCRESDV